MPSIADGLVYEHITASNLEIEAALGIRAHPGLVVHGRGLRSEIGKRDEIAVIALAALGVITFH